MCFKKIPNLVIYFKFFVAPAAVRAFDAIKHHIATRLSADVAGTRHTALALRGDYAKHVMYKTKTISTNI